MTGYFIKIAPENPVLWTGMKGASVEDRKNVVYETTWLSEELHTPFTTQNITWYGRRNIGNGLREKI